MSVEMRHSERTLLDDAEPTSYTSIDTSYGSPTSARPGVVRRRALMGTAALGAAALIAAVAAPRGGRELPAVAGHQPATTSCATLIRTHRDSGDRLKEHPCVPFQRD